MSRPTPTRSPSDSSISLTSCDVSACTNALLTLTSVSGLDIGIEIALLVPLANVILDVRFSHRHIIADLTHVSRLRCVSCLLLYSCRRS